MSDIIDTIDNLARDERDLRCEPNSSRWFKTDQLLCTELKRHWTAIRDRLRSAERKAMAFDAIANRDIEIEFEHGDQRWFAVYLSEEGEEGEDDTDLLTAIEAAIAGSESHAKEAGRG